MSKASLMIKLHKCIQTAITDIFRGILLSITPPVLRAEEGRRMPKDDDDSGISFLSKELEASLARNSALEKENQELKQEVGRLKAQISSLKAHDNERKSMLWKKLQNSFDNSNTDTKQQKPTIAVRTPEQNQAVENLCPRADSPEPAPRKEKPARIPKPPPRPTSVTSPSLKEVNGNKVPLAPAPPRPPPLPSKLLAGSKAVRRVPEVMEFYRSLTRREPQVERANPGGIPTVGNSRNMIGEIENRSSHLMAIKSDVETQGEFINSLTREVEAAAFSEISDVEAFVKWLDQELSYLVDERAVLKHFPKWPERKADALQEAAFSYRDLKNLEAEVSSFEDNPKQPLTQSLRRIQALQDRLERSIANMEKMRDGASKRYKEFQIPWEWMLNTGLISQIKISSTKLAKKYMKRIIKEMQSTECSKEDNLMLQGVRFAYRVHQFAGGFDVDTMQAFEELKRVGTVSNKQQHGINRVQEC